MADIEMARKIMGDKTFDVMFPILFPTEYEELVKKSSNN